MKLTPKKIGLGMALLAGVLIAISGASVSHALVLMPVMFVVSSLMSSSVLFPNGLLNQGLPDDFSTNDDHLFSDASFIEDDDMTDPAMSFLSYNIYHDHDE